MRFPLIPVLIFIAICIIIDAYLFVTSLKRGHRMLSELILGSSVLVYLLFILCFSFTVDDTDSTYRVITWCLFAGISVYFAKLLFIAIDLLACIPILWSGRRWRYITVAGILLGIISFCAFWWGALFNRFNINVVRCDIEIDNIPPAFENFRLVQISDMHTGTYGNDSKFLKSMVDSINNLSPDLIVFTGDIVNCKSDELAPHCPVLSKLKAKYGVIAILGNHDYGDYWPWPDLQAKERNMRQLYDYFNKMNWKLLLNEHTIIKNRNDSIAIIGVENVGEPPFPVYGSLRNSYPSLSDSVIKILLTHNPVHWDNEIAENDSVNIALTLSGHTHAMQMRLGCLSPAALRYKHWAGLYSDSVNCSKIYVNIGIGTVGLPMRLGATPEITEIILKRPKHKSYE